MIDGKNVFFLTIQGDEESEKVSFQLHNNGDVLPLDENISFQKDVLIGTIENPKVLTVSGKNVSVYPNPFTDHLYINVQEEDAVLAKVSIYNIAGSLVYSREHSVASNTPIFIKGSEVAGLASGVYIISVHVNGKQESEKLIKR